MRFLLYNVRYCAGTGGRFHFPLPCSGYLRRTTQNLERITKVIGSYRPDIVGLVEVDGGSFRSEWRNQAEYVASALGHYHSYESKYEERSWARTLPVVNKQINAFVTSDIIQDVKFLYFEHGVKRLVIQLEMAQLVVFLVHLSIKYRHRQYQLSDLYSLIKDVRKPHIVAGDLNAFWGDKEIELFLAATGLCSANTRSVPSYPSWAPRRQLDFVLHSEAIKVTGFQIPQVTYSDHLPLVCDFEIS